MSEVYYFGSEKISPLTVQVDFNDGILKRVVCKEDPVEDKESASAKDKSPTKDDPKKPGIIVFDDAAKKLHLDLNNSPLKIPNDDALTSTVQEKAEINFTSVKCGMRYAIFQDEAGKLYSCGYGNLGELGLGKDKTYTKLPTLIEGMEYKKIVKYDCGPNHAVAFSTENKVYSWGDGTFGRQGVSASSSVFRPQVLTFSKNEVKTTSSTIPTQEDETPVKEFLRRSQPPDFKWIDVACGGDFSLFAAEQGAFGLGRETNGRLGVGAIFEPTYIPLPITYLQKIKIMGVASGKSHSVAWDSEGHAYSWGDGGEGKLGHSIDKGFHMSKFEIYPKRIVALEKYRILMMACGASHTCALTNKGEIFTWGRTASNTKGEKVSYKLLEYFSPRKLTVQSSSDNDNANEPVFVKIVCGPTHNAAIDKDYNLYTWGDGSENCLGFPATDDVVTPTLVQRLSKYKVIDVGCGDNFTFIIACNKDKNFPSKALKSFQEGYLEHMRNTIQNIQEWRKKKVQSDMKIGSFTKPNATTSFPDNYQTSLLDSGVNRTSSFAVTSNTPFLKSYSPSHLLDKVTTPKKPSKKEIGSASKLPYILEASQKITEIIDASSKHPRSPVLPSVAKRNHLSELLMSEPTKTSTSVFSPQSPKFKLNFPTEETRKKTDETQTHGTLNSVRSAFLPIIFNPTEENYKTQPNEAEDFETVFGKKGNVDDYEIYSEPNEDKIKDMMAKHAEQKVQTKNTRVAKSLYEELDTNDDQLKYEYIQMVKSGKEQEHMLYLLQDPESGSAFTETSMKHEKMKMKHQQDAHQEDLKARVLMDTVKKTKETLVSKALPITSDLIYQISGVYNHTKHFLDEKMDARKLSPDDSHIQPVTVVTQEDLAIRAANKKQRTLKVLQKKKEIEYNKKQHLYEKFNKRTEEYKEALRLEKIERQKKAECLKKFSSYFMFETMLNLVRVAADRGLDIKRKLFLYSMKARLIQNVFKKYTIVKKVKTLSPKQNKKLREMVRNYLMNKKVRKIVLMHLRLKLEFKIKASLLLFKTKMSNIKKFLMWTHKKMEAYRYKLTLEWDNHIINNFKLRSDPQVSISDSPLAMSRFKSTIDTPKVLDSSPTREIQTNQIEDFIRRSSRNFRQFVSLQSDGDVRSPLKLSPSVLPTTYELNVDIEFEADTNDNVKSTKKHKNDSVKNPFERLESKLKNFNNLLLPFSYHYCKAMSIQYRINHDTSSPFKDLLFERSVEFEAHLKFEFINKILKECLMKHDADLKEYRRRLLAFKRESNVEINLYRTKKMLNTPVTRLKALQKKEEYQLKRRAAERLSGKKVSQGLKSRELDDYQRDHLPFGTMLLKIAAVMPKAPKMPSLHIALKPQEFNAYFSRYYEAFKARYTHMVAEEREKLFKRKL